MWCVGVQASYVGDSCCAAVGSGDLVLISAGPTYYTASVNTVAVQARQAGLQPCWAPQPRPLSSPALLLYPVLYLMECSRVCSVNWVTGGLCLSRMQSVLKGGTCVMHSP